MKSVWLISEASMDLDDSKKSGYYPFDSAYDKVIAICDSQETAVSFANEHVAHSAKEANDFYNGDGVEILNDNATKDELGFGIAYLKVTDPIEPHVTTFYYIKIKEWMVLEK